MYLELAQQRREGLLVALMLEAGQDMLPPAKLSARLGLSEDQLLALLLGIERVENIEADTARAMGAYLGWPAIAVLMAAGKLRLEDFFTSAALGKAVAVARARWPQLETASELCAVLALVLTGKDVLPAGYLRKVMAEGPRQEA